MAQTNGSDIGWSHSQQRGIMKDSEYNLCMSKFKDRYFVRVDENSIRFIEGRLGKIAPFAPEKQLFGVWCINLASYKKKSILKRLGAVLIEVHQDCEREFGAYFHEKDLGIVCKIIKARKRLQLTNEERQSRSDRAKVNLICGDYNEH